MNPAELHCKWFGHDVRKLEVRTPKLWTGNSDGRFLIVARCARCGQIFEHELTGGQTHFLCEQYELQGDDIWLG